MKVLQVLTALSAGGAEGFVTNLGVSLAELGVDVRFFLMAGVRGERGQVLLKRLRDAGVEVIGAEERNIRSPNNLIRLTRLIRSWRPDIVQANLYAPEVACAMARFLALGSGSRFVRRLPGSEMVWHRSAFLVRLLDRFFGLTVACAPAVALSYERFMKHKYRSRLVSIPNGGLLQDSIPDAVAKQKARQALDLTPDAHVTVHIGRMLGDMDGTGLKSEPKAQDVLLKAFARAFSANPKNILLIVGDGPLRPEAEALAQTLGITQQTRFLGQQPEPWPALHAADMFCFPSRHEGLPNVLPEAASVGLPVVASDIPEVACLSPGDAWIISPVDDVEAFAQAMREMHKLAEVYKKRAEDVAQTFRDKFSMKVCAEKYIREFESELGKNLKKS